MTSSRTSRLRSKFPPNGPAYELFDTSILLIALGLIGYILTPPPTVTNLTLVPLEFFPPPVVGGFLLLGGTAGIIGSYRTDLLRAGYIATISVTLAMAAWFAIGAVVTQEMRPFVSVFIYGWMARRLMRDNEEMV